MRKLGFLQALEEAGIQFTVSAYDGYTNLDPIEVMDYLKNRDALLARRAGVSLEQFTLWKHVGVPHHIPLREFLERRLPSRSLQNKSSIPTTSPNIRWEIWERDNFTCRNCGSRHKLSIDHIIPVSKGGQTIKENLQTLCTSCNVKKGNGKSVTE